MPRKKKIEEETVNTEPVKEVVPEEQVPIEEVVVVSGKSNINKETYLEFFDTQLKSPANFRSAVFMCLIMCLYLYLFRGEAGPLEVLMRCLICCAIIVFVTLVFNLITRFVSAPKNYEKSGLNKLDIELSFSNLGVRQTIEENGEKQSGLIYWTQIMRAIETPNSFFFLSQRNGLICSKANFSEVQLEQIRNITLEHLGESRFKKSGFKKNKK